MLYFIVYDFCPACKAPRVVPSYARGAVRPRATCECADRPQLEAPRAVVGVSQKNP